MPPWFTLALLLCLCLAATDVLYRSAFARGYTPHTMIFWSTFLGLCFYIAYALVARKGVQMPKTPVDTALFLLVGLLFFVGFYLLRRAQEKAPNLALVNAIAYSSVALTVVLMWWLFGDPLTLRMLLGCALIVTGIYVMAFL